jgi:alkylation response protein AidB-like acyl-CoA dehydrogenase
MTWHAAELKDQGRRDVLETSSAKLFASEAALRCADAAIQVHGGAGYVDDHVVERLWRDARVTTLYEGTTQIQELILGRELTGLDAMTPS